MNIAAQIKNLKKQSKYVVNLSFDIPMQSHRQFNDQPVSGQFTISQLHPKKNLKIKIGSVKATQQSQSRRLPAVPDVHKISLIRNDKKYLDKPNNKVVPNIGKHIKNLSCPHSKSPSRIGSYSHRQSYSVSQSFNIKALKNKIICSVDDDIVGYTNPSSQLKKQQKLTDFSYNNTKPRSRQRQQSGDKRSPLVTPPLKKFKSSQAQQIQLLSEIKKIQINAIEKKKLINFEYIRQKILMQACARKIQRTWKSYKTKKLIRTYSHTLSLKFSNKMKHSQNETFYKQPKILNVKSCGFKNGQNQLKMKLKQTKQFFMKESQKQKQQTSQQNKQTQQKNQLMKQLQLEQIKKWQQFIKQLRQNRNVEQVLNQINKQKYGFNKQQKQIQDVRLKNTISKIQSEETKKYIESTINILEKSKNKGNIIGVVKFNTSVDSKQQLQKIEQILISPKSHQIHKIQRQEESQKKYIQHKTKQQKINIQQAQNYLKKQDNNKKLQQTKISQKKFKIKQNKNQSQNIVKKQQQKINYQKVAVRNKVQYQQQITKDKIKFIIQVLKQTDDQDKKLSIEQQMGFVMNMILNDLYNQFVFQCRKHVRLLKQLKSPKKQQPLAQKSISQQTKYISKNKLRQQSTKAQGICTNMDSIKDYLENLISFIFEQHPQLFIQSFNTPKGMNTYELLQQFNQIINNQKTEELLYTDKPFSQKMINKQIFQQHWAYASQQIYFQRKFEDDEFEEERVIKLKHITKVFFASIFDSYNQCLQIQRIYGPIGYPQPWIKIPIPQQMSIYSIEQSKPKIKSAFKRLSDICLMFCGMMFEDKRTYLSNQMMQDIKEERIKKYLQSQIKQTNYPWQHFERIQAYIFTKISQIIFEILLIELFQELQIMQMLQKCPK